VVTFRVWAPDTDRVRLRAGDADHELARGDGGWWSIAMPSAGPGTDYAYLLGDDPTPLPDPRSFRQPDGVHGPSRVYDHAAFDWSDAGWTGRALQRRPQLGLRRRLLVRGA
jgi:maltooligosyltrehalose trehalohydrolase